MVVVLVVDEVKGRSNYVVVVVVVGEQEKPDLNTLRTQPHYLACDVEICECQMACGALRGTSWLCWVAWGGAGRGLSGLGWAGRSGRWRSGSRRGASRCRVGHACPLSRGTAAASPRQNFLLTWKTSPITTITTIITTVTVVEPRTTVVKPAGGTRVNLSYLSLSLAGRPTHLCAPSPGLAW
ncbi:hypothetical protein E2C01_057436 [Portunus trituberculatus]|uniref:Uncharacterized protein n=1 Tax=Portunus trituberculatus TaxID=210409 RepID=A0A5B7H1W2_PORTR|nr:hypothetical protein [Portunus trituberculatus]